MKRTVTALTVALMMLATIVGPAMAVVVYDAEDLHAWDWQVGKGDVQSAFGWSAKQTDARFDAVTFTYTKVKTVVISCVNTANGQYQEIVGSKTEIDSTTRLNAVEPRRNKSSVVNGAYITKTGQPVSSESDSACTAGYERNGLKETSTRETLTARYSGQDSVIWTLES
jgi:hypothetical protein